MEMRMMSRESKNMVYHRPECRYAQKIQKRNRVQVNREKAEQRGYHPCSYCNSMRFFYNRGEFDMELFSKHNNIDVDLKDNKIYVRTDVGCWKIIYTKGLQRFILLHRNHVDGRICLEEVENGPYHRQKDVPEAETIMQYLHYIKSHDNFKQNMESDIRRMPQRTKQQRAYYHSAKRRAERRSARRLDNLFLLIERQEGMKELSFC